MTDGTRTPDGNPGPDPNPAQGDGATHTEMNAATHTDKPDNNAPAATAAPPAETERRPPSSGSQVVSARLPSALVAELNRHAEEQGLKLSEVLRAAVEYYLRREHNAVPMTLSMSYGVLLRGITPVWPLGTENRVVAEQPEPLTYVPALSDDQP